MPTRRPILPPSLSTLRYRAAVARVDVDCSRAPTLWFYDQALVRMVLANAVQNAARHARTRIAIEVAERDGFLEFLVRDDGSGFADPLLNDAGGSARPVSSEGTGLGLRLALRIAEMHENAGQRGQIRLANDRGAVFRLQPCCRRRTTNSRARRPSAGAGIPASP
jgi:signal transduction histidine kinase